jgi:hypothetical protein
MEAPSYITFLCILMGSSKLDTSRWDRKQEESEAGEIEVVLTVGEDHKVRRRLGV